MLRWPPSRALQIMEFMFTTTFPCHDCAKHIVAAGIKRVVYVEPYPKSLVQELYPDSIAVDVHTECEGRVQFEPFVGIAPKRYGDLFALLKRKRKNRDGTVATWRRSYAVPTPPEYLPSPLARVAAESLPTVSGVTRLPLVVEAFRRLIRPAVTVFRVPSRPAVPDGSASVKQRGCPKSANGELARFLADRLLFSG